MENLDPLRYPIGKFSPPEMYTKELINQWIDDIEQLPQLISDATNTMTDAQLDTTYRPGGWTARQVVHHVADSHINSYTRFKLALTENHPSIKPYEEGEWANLKDGISAPIFLSINLLEALHARWVILLRNISAKQLERTFFHPESKKIYVLKENIGVYSWHGRHHLAHIHLVKSNS